MRTCRMLLLPPFLLLFSLLAACGGPQATPTVVVEGTRPPSPVVPPPWPTQTSLPTQALQPTPLPTGPALPTTGAVPDLSAAYEAVKALPGFHYEALLKGQHTGETPDYLRIVENMDAEGNFHLLIYDQEGDKPVADYYYVQKHMYVGTDGSYVDLGVQEEEQISNYYQVYILPFALALQGATDLQPVGQETVGGLLTTKYRANFSTWARSYLELEADISYQAEGFIWISERYAAIVKSQVHVSWKDEDQEAEYEAEDEISQVGQIPPIAPPK